MFSTTALMLLRETTLLDFSFMPSWAYCPPPKIPVTFMDLGPVFTYTCSRFMISNSTECTNFSLTYCLFLLKLLSPCFVLPEVYIGITGENLKYSHLGSTSDLLVLRSMHLKTPQVILVCLCYFFFFLILMLVSPIISLNFSATLSLIFCGLGHFSQANSQPWTSLLPRLF